MDDSALVTAFQSNVSEMMSVQLEHREVQPGADPGGGGALGAEAPPPSLLGFT